MKSIKEKAREYYRVIEVINENESIVDTKGSEMFEQGANYVLEQIESACMNGVYAKDKYRNVLNVLEQLKK